MHRELNWFADHVAGNPTNPFMINVSLWQLHNQPYLVLTFDGSSSKHSVGCAWVLHASDGSSSNMSELKPLAFAAYQLPEGTTANDAELIAFKPGLSFMHTMAAGRNDLWSLSRHQLAAKALSSVIGELV